jgi:hypothetical protein
MNEKGRPEAARLEHRRARSVTPPPARVTGVQVAIALFDATLVTLKAQLGPREWVVLLDVLRRRLDRKLELEQRTRRRWAA